MVGLMISSCCECCARAAGRVLPGLCLGTRGGGGKWSGALLGLDGENGWIRIGLLQIITCLGDNEPRALPAYHSRPGLLDRLIIKVNYTDYMPCPTFPPTARLLFSAVPSRAAEPNLWSAAHLPVPGPSTMRPHQLPQPSIIATRFHVCNHRQLASSLPTDMPTLAFPVM